MLILNRLHESASPKYVRMKANTDTTITICTDCGTYTIYTSSRPELVGKESPCLTCTNYNVNMGVFYWEIDNSDVGIEFPPEE
jgi:hypothetical protein